MQESPRFAKIPRPGVFRRAIDEQARESRNSIFAQNTVVLLQSLDFLDFAQFSLLQTMKFENRPRRKCEMWDQDGGIR
jgi:hypothetical protein